MSRYSFVTAPVEALSSTGAVLQQGTAFFYKRDKRWLYVVTNWHVVTDRVPTSPRTVRSGPVPVSLRLRLHRNVGPEKFSISQKLDFDLELNDEFGNAPTWLEHPVHGYRCDVVVLRVARSTQLEQLATFALLDEEPELQRNYVPQPMADAFVIGYPWGQSSGDGVIPLYKRGSVASDVRFDHDGLPRFLIDCRTASGMSGAPVLASHSGIWMPNGTMDDDAAIGTVTNFVGVYSGRLVGPTLGDRMAQEISELGVVWKTSALEQIVESGKAGTRLDSL